jgi:hypothetical protein
MTRFLPFRGNWYDQATDDYRLGRPRYPNDMIDRVCRAAPLRMTTMPHSVSNNNDNSGLRTETELPSPSRMLEIGCGPRTATLSFCQRGITMVAHGSKSLSIVPVSWTNVEILSRSMTGHTEHLGRRLDWIGLDCSLLQQQRSDGGWGDIIGCHLVCVCYFVSLDSGFDSFDCTRLLKSCNNNNNHHPNDGAAAAVH